MIGETWSEGTEFGGSGVGAALTSASRLSQARTNPRREDWSTTIKSLGLRSGSVRQSNLAAILRQIHISGPASRSDLVAHTGLTRSAVADLVGELTDLGFVREAKAASDGTPGRPSPLVVPRSEDNVVLAMEVLVDSIAVAVVGVGGVRLRSVRRDRARERTPVERTVQDLAGLVAEIVDDLPPTTALFGVGVAVAGLVRHDDGTVTIGPNIGWTDVDIARQLREALGVTVPVSVMNDGDLGALAEMHRGAAAGLDDVLHVSCEVGVGGGMVSGGVAMAGASGFAGEVGHLMVNIDGEICSCGAVGCWETEVGEEALLRRVGRPVAGGRRVVREVIAAAAAGDPMVCAALEEHGRWVGVGLAGLVNILNPQAIVLGGFLGPALPYLSGSLDAELRVRALAPSVENLKILPAMLGSDAPLLGAAEFAWDVVLRNVGASSSIPLGSLSAHIGDRAPS